MRGRDDGGVAPHPDPTDAEVEATLRAAPPERWRALAAAADEVAAQPPAEWVRWEVGRRVDGATHMPYPVYSDAVERLHGALGAVGAVVVFGWTDWEEGQRYDAAALATAPAADAARVVTSVVRGERFGDGTIAAALDDGRLLAAARRLVEWWDSAQ